MTRFFCLHRQLSLVTTMLIRRKYSGAHILFEVRPRRVCMPTNPRPTPPPTPTQPNPRQPQPFPFKPLIDCWSFFCSQPQGIECVCSSCVKCKWGWEVAAITADPRRKALYERLGRENPMTAPHHVELSEQLSDLASAHRTSTAVGVFDHTGLERARGAGDKSILCPLHQKQVNLVQLFGGEAGTSRGRATGGGEAGPRGRGGRATGGGEAGCEREQWLGLREVSDR